MSALRDARGEAVFADGRPGPFGQWAAVHVVLVEFTDMWAPEVPVCRRKLWALVETERAALLADLRAARPAVEAGVVQAGGYTSDCDRFVRAEDAYLEGGPLRYLLARARYGRALLAGGVS